MRAYIHGDRIEIPRSLPTGADPWDTATLLAGFGVKIGSVVSRRPSRGRSGSIRETIEIIGTDADGITPFAGREILSICGGLMKRAYAGRRESCGKDY